MSDHVVFIETKRLILRPFEEADLPFITRWINQPEMRAFLAVRTPYSQSAEAEWLKSIMHQPVPPREIVFAVALKETGELIGAIGLHLIDWINRRATTGSYIGDKEHRGKGFGKEMKLAVLEYAFETLDLQKIKSEANADNLASIACLKSCGYVQEGIRRSEMFINGRRVDSVLFGITREDRQGQKWERAVKAGYFRQRC